MKNKKIYAFFGFVLAVALGSCSDDEIVKGTPAEKGAEVRFGAQLENPRSRTYYGEQDGNAFPIYWNEEAKGFDKIFIYAPKALSGRNQAYYTVRPTDDRTAPAPVVKIGDVGVQWGTESTKFYGFYPGNENFNLSTSGNTAVSATLPGDQTITFDYKLDVNNASGYTFETNPDMSCVMMVAKTEALEPTTEAIGLEFEPLSTVIDITVNGPEEGNTVNPYRVTAISLSANKQICGRFTYDYERNEITELSPEMGDSMITVRTMGMDSKGDFVGVPLHTGQKLNVKISMLPYTDVTGLDLKVQVTTADSKVWTKTLDVTHLGAGQINPVELPKLRAGEAELDFSRWISQLDPRIYISELSLPGSALAFNIYDVMENDKESATQYGTLTEQFNAGSRIFQGHIWLIPGESPIDHKQGQFVLTTSAGVNTGITLMHACTRLQEEMEKSHSHGFCVLMLSDYSIAGTSFKLDDVYERFQDVSAELQRRNILAPDITPTTTIADVRGKIILKLQLTANIDYSGSNVDGTNSALSNIQKQWESIVIDESSDTQTKSLFNIWTSDAGKNVCYSPMTFGTIGSYTFTEASREYILWPPHYEYTPAVITEVRPGLRVEVARRWITTASASNAGSLNLTTSPSADEFGRGMWYIYNEQAEAGKNDTQCQTNIQNMLNVIPATYKVGADYNKIYMTWVGGVGSNYGADVKNSLNAKWLSSSNTLSQVGQNYPLGWVLFNDVTDYHTGGTSTASCIQRVIEQNTKEGFLLGRNRNASVNPAVAPNSDASAANGGVVFAPRR